MDLLDRLLGHDAWTTRQLLGCCQGLTDDQLDREFDIGHRTARATLAHIIRNVEVWTDLMSRRPIRGNGREQDERCSIPEMITRLDRAAVDLATLARAVAQREAWDERWVDYLDDPPREKTFGGGIAHVVTHSMHHRAQVLYILRRLGLPKLPEGDVLSWEQVSPPRES